MDLETKNLLNEDIVLGEVLKKNGINALLPFVTYNLKSTSKIVGPKLNGEAFGEINFKTKVWYKIAASITFGVFYGIILISIDFTSDNDKIGLIIYSVLMPLLVLYFWTSKKFNNVIVINQKELRLKSKKIEWKEVCNTYILTMGTKQSEHYLVLTLKNQNYIQENISGIVNSGNSIESISQAIERFKV
jgi:hypothetical protein